MAGNCIAGMNGSVTDESNSSRLQPRANPQSIQPGSLEEFITEHYWGYTARGRRCTEYQVEHPPWRVWPATEPQFQGDVATLYGTGFVEPLAAPPSSAFIAEGSLVVSAPRQSAYLTGLAAKQLPQDERQNAAVPVVIDLDRRIDPQFHRERSALASPR